jgi:branched-subunit amino acid aminotransferase/4-amino-4-deoxychorismate lyase
MLARRAGVPVREERLSVDRVRRAEESFLTASSVEIVPVVRLGGRRVADGRPGAITRRLQAAYAAHVARRLAAGR